jgi:hypothetical protein
MPSDKRAEIEARLARYRPIERQLATTKDHSRFELSTLRLIIADLEVQLKELDK